MSVDVKDNLSDAAPSQSLRPGSGGSTMALEIKQALKELTGKADQLKEYL